MLLVHVAGMADLGISLARDGRQRDRGEVGEEAGRRLAQLRECASDDVLADLLFDLRFTPAGTEVGGSGLPHAVSPLRKELRAVAHHEPAEGDDDGRVEVLIIGVKGGRTPTADLATVLAAALERVSTAAGRLAGGAEVAVLRPCVLNGLDVSPSQVTELDERIGAHAGHVLIGLGGGANALLVEAAGVTAATHPDQWSLVLIDRAGDDQSPGAAHRIDMSLTAEDDPLRGWLMSLGLPTVLVQEYGRREDEGGGHALPAEVTQAAAAIRRAAGEGDSDAPPSAGDLAQLLWTDMARGDLAGLMALRAWVVAEYRRRRLDYLRANGLTDQDHPDVTRAKGGSRRLGCALGDLDKKDGSTLPEPEKWLLEHRHLNELGIAATHRFASSDGRPIDQLRQALGGDPPEWLSWPSGRVCLLSGQGVGATPGPAVPEDASQSAPSRPDRRKPPRPSLPVTLLSAPPDALLSGSCGVPGPLSLDVLVACSDQTLDAGRSLVQELCRDDFVRNGGWQPVRPGAATAVSYGASTTADGAGPEQVENTMEQVRLQADQWLEEHRPRAILTTILGEKPVAISLLRTAQAYGARHGIPVFLVSSVRRDGSDKEHPQFHQFGLDRDVRQALLRATDYCLERLDLRTAARLLALGDPVMKELATQARQLSEELVEAVRAQDIDAYVGTILAVMTAVADRVDAAPPEAQARLATIVGELVNKPRDDNTGAFRRPVVLELAPGDFNHRPTVPASADVLLRLLVQVRNDLPINHGSQQLSAVVGERLTRVEGPPRWGYSQLLHQAVEAVSSGHQVGPGDWADRFTRVADRVKALSARSRKEVS